MSTCINEVQRKIILGMYRDRKDVQEIFSKCENVKYFPSGEYKNIKVENALFEHPTHLTNVIVTNLCILIGGPKDSLIVDGERSHFETLIAIDYPTYSIGRNCEVNTVKYHPDIKLQVHERAKIKIEKSLDIWT